MRLPRELLRPALPALAAMGALTLGGAAAGLVPPIAVGRIVDAAHGGRGTVAVAWAALVAAAVLVEGAAYALSDRSYAGAAARITAGLRTAMFAGLVRRGVGPAERTRFASRFVSDAETVEQTTVAALDQAVVAGFELLATAVALAFVAGTLVLAAATAMAAGTVVLRRLNGIAAGAAHARQEALERMSHALARDDAAFAGTVETLADADRRLGTLAALSQHGSAVLAGLGPLLVLVVGVAAGGATAGVLVSSYLLAGRAFAAAERLIDVSFEIDVARAATGRCLELV